MKTVRDVMTTDVIWLSPTNKVKTAIILMKGRNIGGLPVLDGDQVVGVLDYHDILGKDTDVPVQHIMNKEFVSVPPDMPIADAADLMIKIGNGRLLITEGNQLIGVLTRGDLLPELGKSLDPLTGLARADAMRDWGIDALKRGREITVIFIDLDQLAPFNKKYGHITGDKAIKHMSQVLQSCIDEQVDMLCRYGGDEFVIVSVRNGDEARALAGSIAERLRNTPNAELPDPVTGTVGVHGGKRTKEREQVHYEATLDNLINLASKACTLAKNEGAPVLLEGAGTVSQAAERESPAEPAAPGPAPSRQEFPAAQGRRLRIQSLNLSWGAGSTATADVELSDGEKTCKRSHSGFALGNSALRLVADATAEAISEFLTSPDYGVIAENVHMIRDANGEDIVLITALLVTPQAQVRVSGSSIVRQDAYRATAAALLDAVNRRISTQI